MAALLHSIAKAGTWRSLPSSCIGCASARGGAERLYFMLVQVKARSRDQAFCADACPNPQLTRLSAASAAAISDDHDLHSSLNMSSAYTLKPDLTAQRLHEQVTDEGGGIPRSGMPRIWTYLYSTAESPLEKLSAEGEGEDSPAALAGYGYGLPISRLYARYFGGDLQVSAIWARVQTVLKGLRMWSRPFVHRRAKGMHEIIKS